MLSFTPKFRREQRAISVSSLNAISGGVEHMQNQIARRTWNLPNTAYAKNVTGDTLDEFSVVQLKQMVDTDFTGGELVAFKQRVLYEAEKPEVDDSLKTPDNEHAGNQYAILLSNCQTDAYCRVALSGPVQCRINVTENEHEWCTAANGQTDYLESQVYGESYILDREEGTGIKWAIVLLNAHHYGQSDNPQTDLSSCWELRDQGTKDGEPATGVKFSIVTVDDESYVPGSDETVRTVQFDSHGHLIEVCVPENSSSMSSVTESDLYSSASSDQLNQSSSSSEYDSSESSSLGTPDFDLAGDQTINGGTYTQTANTNFDEQPGSYSARLDSEHSSGSLTFDIENLPANTEYNIFMRLSTDETDTAPYNTLTVQVGSLNITANQTAGLNYKYEEYGTATSDANGKIQVTCSASDPDSMSLYDHCYLSTIEGWEK